MKQDYAVFVCNTRELAEQHGTYVSPDSGPFHASRSSWSAEKWGEDREWAIYVPHTEDRDVEHIVQDGLSLYLAMEFTDRLNAACRLWANTFRKDES